MNSVVEYIITVMKINRNMRQRFAPDSERTLGYCKAVDDLIDLIEKFQELEEGAK